MIKKSQTVSLLKINKAISVHRKTINFSQMIVMPAKDLSTVHELISDLFKWPSDKEEWAQYKLSNDQVEFFQKMVSWRV